MFKYLIVLFSAFNFSLGKTLYTREQQMKDQFNDFLKIHNKNYPNSAEYQKHFEIFHENLSRIKTYHNGERTCKMYLTQYSDLTTDSTYDYDTCKKFIPYKPNMRVE
jgi:hypothetical protein